MPVNPMESLRTLMRLPSVSNVSNLSDEGLDIAQGLGDYAPSEAELMGAQEQTGGAISREMIRKSAMANIKQKLMAGQQAQAYKLQQDQAGHQRDLSKQRLANEGQENVARINTEGKAAQAEAAARAKAEMADAMIQGAAGSGRSVSVSGVGGIGPQPRQPGQGSSEPPTEGMLKRLQESKGRFEGFSPLSSLYEKFTGKPSGEREAYGSALSDVLSRSGSMETVQQVAGLLAKYPGTLQQKIAAAQAASEEEFPYDLSGLDPYEQQYLQFKLGQ